MSFRSLCERDLEWLLAALGVWLVVAWLGYGVLGEIVAHEVALRRYQKALNLAFSRRNQNRHHPMMWLTNTKRSGPRV